MPDSDKVVHLNFYDLLILIARWRKLFFVNCFIVTLISVVTVFVMPVWYRATTVILPPAGGGGLPSFLSKDLAGVAANFGLEMPTEDIYQTILASRTLKERIIERFNLREVYKFDESGKPEDLIRGFEAHYGINTREDLAIEVSFEDQDPQLAADIANACVAELDKFYSEITSASARNNRIFIGRRLAQINDTLAYLQDNLRNFQKQYNTVSIPDQSSVMITAAANLKAEQISAEIQLQLLKSTMGDRHPEVIQMKKTSEELEKRYLGMLDGSEGELFLALNQLPELSQIYAEIYRQIRIQSALLEFVYPQFENARIQEERESANVQILDNARVPQKKVRPARRIIVMVAAAASVLFTLIMIMLIEYWHKIQGSNQKDWQKIQELKRTFIREKK